MFYISKKEFNKKLLENPDYICKCIVKHEHNGRICMPGDYMGFEGAITGDYSRETVLIFEHIHFEIEGRC